MLCVMKRKPYTYKHTMSVSRHDDRRDDNAVMTAATTATKTATTTAAPN